MLILHEFWEAMRTRLDTATMQAILGGAGRVYVPSDGQDDIPAVEGDQDQPWGQIVMLPRETLWPQKDEPGTMQNVAWIASVRFNDYRASGYDVGISVGAAHAELFARLDNWVPDPQPTKVVIVVPVWRESSPSASPLFDQSRNLWLSNAQFRTQAVTRQE